MFENPRRGRQAKKFYNKCSENSRSQIVFRTDIFRKLSLSAPKFLARADKQGSTPCDAVFCLFVPVFFPVWSLFLNTIFPFGFFFFILTADPAGHALGSIYILSLSPEFYFGKGISKALDLHTGQAYDQIKTISCQDMSLLWNSSMLVDFMTNNTQYTTNCTNLHTTSTSDPLAKVKLAFCTSS